MPAFRRVDMENAGKSALGILVPGGKRTFVVVRPRSLPWDLLPARWAGDPCVPPTFCSFDREEAAVVARRFQKSLEAAVRMGENPVQTLGSADPPCFQVWVRTEDLVWITCRRTPGQAYQPIVFATQAEAIQVAEQLSSLLWPDVEANQEYYFNTQKLSQDLARQA